MYSHMHKCYNCKKHYKPKCSYIFLHPIWLQILLCSAVKLFRGGKKDTNVGEVCSLTIIIIILIQTWFVYSCWSTCFLKLATWMQLNKFYMEICKSALIPPVGILELSSICRVLSDQVRCLPFLLYSSLVLHGPYYKSFYNILLSWKRKGCS